MGTFGSIKITVSKLSRIYWIFLSFFGSEMSNANQELIFRSRTAALSPSCCCYYCSEQRQSTSLGFLSVVSPYGDNRVGVVLE